MPSPRTATLREEFFKGARLELYLVVEPIDKIFHSRKIKHAEDQKG